MASDDDVVFANDFEVEEEDVDPSSLEDNDQQALRYPENEENGGWEIMEDPLNVQLMNVETFLLKSAKLEFSEIRKRSIDAFRKVLPNKNFSTITQAQMAVMWITPFLNEFYECVNVDPQLPHYSREICLGFVMHECMKASAWYSCHERCIL